MFEIISTGRFFEADKSYTEKILKGFKGQEFKKRKINVEVSEGRKKVTRSDSGRYKKRDSFKRKSVGRKAERKRKKRK